MTVNADAVIIGGGSHGCSIAYHMAKKGWKNIILLEKGYLASGATGRCAAGIRHQFGTEINIRLSMESVKRMERLQDELEYDVDIELMQKGYLMLAHSEAELELFRNNVDNQKLIDPNNTTEILDPKQVMEILPHLRLNDLVGASYNEKDGHVNPFHVTQAYANAARRLGVDIRTYTEVAKIEKEGCKVTGVVLDNGEKINTSLVVIAAGPHTKLLGAMIDIDIPLTPERHQIMVTEPLEMFLWPMVISFVYGTYYKQTPHGSLLLGVGDPEHEVKEFNERSTWQYVKDAAEKITAQMPILKEVNVIRQWAGLYDVTPDQQGIVGPTEIDGVLIDCGWSGHGFQLAPAIGQTMAEMAAGEKPFIDMRCMSIERFAKGELIPEPACV